MYVLDRFEGDIALVEASGETGSITFLKVTRAALPPHAKEGDVLQKVGGNSWQVDALYTDDRRQTIANRLEKLKNK